MTHPELKKISLAAEDASALESARMRAVGELLDPEQPRANVVGVATGVKWTDGEPTGQPALLVLVTHKLDKGDIPKEELVPATIATKKTDVLEIGFPTAEQTYTPVVENGKALLDEDFAVPQTPLVGAEISPAGCGPRKAATRSATTRSRPARSAPACTTCFPARQPAAVPCTVSASRRARTSYPTTTCSQP
jgi:hypothetical protein